MTYFILYAVSLVLKDKVQTIRVLTASVFGGIYSCFMFFEKFSILYSFLFKIIFSLFTVFIAYKSKGFFIYIKKVIVFYLVSFILGGVTFFVVSLANVKNVMTANGVYYFEIPIHLFLVSSLICYFFVSFFSGEYTYNKKMCYKTVNVCLNGKLVNLICLVDTGNLLTDPITNESVIVCELDAIKSIFSKKTYDFFKDYICDIKDEIDKIKIRIIPFTSLGNESGFLLGFKPDFVFIDGNKVNNVVIGVYNKKLSNKHNYNALIGCWYGRKICWHI